MNIFKKIMQLTGRKKCYYLHIAYKAQFGKSEWLESDRFFTLHDCTLTELRQSIQNMVEKEAGKQVETLSLVNITELSKGLFDMLTRSETFKGLRKED